MLPPNNRKGSGFTNINRVVTANQGNNLGQTVSSGVQNQANQVKQQTQQSTTNFNTAAQKNRLDTDENKAKRSDVIGRFDENNYQVINDGQNQAPASSGSTQAAPQSGSPSQNVNAPLNSRYAVDMSKYQGNTNLQTKYDADRKALTDQQAQYKAANDQQRAGIQARIDADQATRGYLQDAKNAEDRIAALGGYDPSPTNFEDYLSQMMSEKQQALNQADYDRTQALYKASGSTDKADEKYLRIQGVNTGIQGLDASLGSLNNLLNTIGTNSATQDQEIASKLSALESQFGEMTSSDKEKWIQSEKDRLMAENAPTEEEASQFDKFRAGQYEGPKQLEDYQTLAGKAQNTELLGELSRSTGGRQELLKRFVGGSGYTQGEQNLDNLLLGQSGNALNQTRRATQGLTEGAAKANSQATNLAQEYANRAKLFGDETTDQLTKARDPLSTRIDKQLSDTSTKDDIRKGNLNELQDILLGRTADSQQFTKDQRLSAALEEAAQAGYLNSDQAGALVGDNGLLKRAQNLGLDPNSLISDRLQGYSSKNLNRQGVASNNQETSLNNLDRLLGKKGIDAEFGTKGGDYQKSGVGFDLGSLNDDITRAEQNKGVASDGGSNLNHQSWLGNGLSSLVNSPTDYYNDLMSMDAKKPGEALAKLSGYDRLKDIWGVENLFGSNSEGHLLGNIGDAVGNFVKGIGSGFGAGKTGNWATEEYGMNDAKTGQAALVGSYANSSSKDIMNQLMNSGVIDQTANMGKGGAEQSKIVNKLIDYYNAAVQRESQTKTASTSARDKLKLKT